MSGTAVVLQTESAAVQSLTTSRQLETIPTSGRAWQTTIALMPGVAQPDYSQSGGSNNPTRAMAISINGQPANNTVVRLDGVTQINQFFQQIQAYSPSLEAIETVSVVTNSFDADQGMAGGASVNVQVKSGTNNLSGFAFEYAQDYRMKAKNYFLPAGDPEGQRQRARLRRHGGRPDRAQQVVLLRQRGEHAPANDGRHRVVEFRRQRAAESSDDGRCATGNFAGTSTVIYDPRTGAANGTGRVPFAFANCGINVHHRSAVRLVQLHPGEPHQPDRDGRPEQAGRAHTAGISVQLLRDQQIRHGLPTSTTGRSPGCRTTGLPSTDGSATRQLRGQRARAAVCGEWDRHEWPNNPIWQGRIWDSTVHSHSLAVTNIVSPTSWWTACSALRAPTCWRARTRMTAGESMFGIPNSVSRRYGRSTAFPAMNASTLVDLPAAASRAPTATRNGAGTMNAGWTKGGHNVKFGGEMKRLHQNHYETQTPTFTFTGGRTALGPAGSPNNFNAFADFLLGEANSRTLGDHDADDRRSSQTGRGFPARRRCGHGSTARYIRDQFELNRKMTVSAGVRWEYYPLSQRRDRGLEVFDFNARQLLICGAGRQFREPAASRWKRISSRRGSAGHIAPPTRRSSASAIRAIRRTTRRAENQMPPFNALPGHDHLHGDGAPIRIPPSAADRRVPDGAAVLI